MAKKLVDTDTGEILDPAASLRAAISIFDEEFKDLTLAGKLARIMGMIGNIPKKGVNSFHHYSYVREEDLVAVIRPYLAAAGIVMLPTIVSHELIDQGQTKAGATNWLTIIQVNFSITDGASVLTVSSIGYGQDTADKGANKAFTAAVKYALMKMFLVDTGDDPEADSRTDQRSQETAPREIRVEPHRQAGVARGGHAATATPAQIRKLGEVMQEARLDRATLLVILKKEVGVTLEITSLTEEQQRDRVTETLRALTTPEMGKVISAAEEWAIAREEEARQDANG